MNQFLSKPTGNLPKPIAPPLPEVYQIETVATCNLQCIMCPRQFFAPRYDDRQFLAPDLLEKIIKQGDLDASYFVELQISGEPLLHPELKKIIYMVKQTGVLVGLSTNGTLIRNQMDALLSLDYITLSLDSITNRNKIRRAKADAIPVDILINDMKFLLQRTKDLGIVVDIQVVELDGWEEQVELIKEEFYGYTYNLRTNPNCYLAFIHKDIPLPVSTELCLNPWLSASIMTNGNVSPCCISHGDDVIYGNLYKQTLREIWAGDEVKQFREEHITKDYREVCARCYMRSPYLFHQQLYFSEIRKRYVNNLLM